MSRAATVRMAVGMVGVLLAVGGLTSCGRDQPANSAGPAAATATTTSPSPTAPSPTAASTPRPGAEGAKRCQVTLPSHVGPPGVSPRDFFGWGDTYGNGKLWVGGLWPGGVINADAGFINKDGSVGMKFGWWRAAPGKLRITGRRLDASAPPARATVPDGYGETGFQASGVDSPPRAAGKSPGRCPRPA
ncbi:MAG TPA: hypothetical protein VF880_16280 [Actinomycetes bacterium]